MPQECEVGIKEYLVEFGQTNILAPNYPKADICCSDLARISGS